MGKSRKKRTWRGNQNGEGRRGNRSSKKEDFKFDPIKMPGLSVEQLLDPIEGRIALVRLQYTLVQHAASKGWPKVFMTSTKGLQAAMELAWQKPETNRKMSDVIGEIVTGLDEVSRENPAEIRPFRDQLSDLVERLVTHESEMN